MIGLLLALTLGQLSDSVLVLGRCPVEAVSEVVGGRFLEGEWEQGLVVESLGGMRLSLTDGKKTVVEVFRLVLLRLTSRGWEMVWRSSLMLGSGAERIGLSPHFWSGGDVDGDSLLELIIAQGDSVQIYHFGPDSIFSESWFIPTKSLKGVAWGDIDSDSIGELVTLEQISDSLGSGYDGVRLWRLGTEGLEPRSGFLAIPEEGRGLEFSLLGPCRLDDYFGVPVVLSGEHQGLKPSLYAVVFYAGEDSFAVTTNPFPYGEWFSRNEVLAMGRLKLFNVGDTLVGYGYFVPGVRAGGPKESFAALQDGEWHLLRLKDRAQRLSGPVCRFSYQGKEGWLELREGVFYFYPESPFYWWR